MVPEMEPVLRLTMVTFAATLEPELPVAVSYSVVGVMQMPVPKTDAAVNVGASV